MLSRSVMSNSLWPDGLHGILQARTLEWVAMSFSRGSSQPRGWTQVSRIAGRFFTVWATREACGRHSIEVGWMEGWWGWTRDGFCQVEVLNSGKSFHGGECFLVFWKWWPGIYFYPLCHPQRNWGGFYGLGSLELRRRTYRPWYAHTLGDRGAVMFVQLWRPWEGGGLPQRWSIKTPSVSVNRNRAGHAVCRAYYKGNLLFKNDLESQDDDSRALN